MAQTLSHVSSISMQIFVELYLKPVVDLIQCKLSSAGLIDCLKKFFIQNSFDLKIRQHCRLSICSYFG